MAELVADKLSRAVSELDLNAALRNVQTLQSTGLRYTTEALLSLRPGAKKHEEEADSTETDEVADGVKTPPERTCPNPPPPTPATPETAVQADEKVETVEKTKEVSASLALPASEPAKKKKKKSGSAKKAPPTGFEEFYADPPITPAEYEEEKYELYDPGERSFAERIQTCIQRYRARRKLDETRSNILTKYFTLGGVESTKKMFTGQELDEGVLANASAAEIEALKAHDFIRTDVKSAKYYDGSDDWVVDFEGVAKGFFSYRLPTTFPLDDEKQIKSYCAIIRNFLNYVLQHEVCPEYTEDVMAARRVCGQAEEELWAICQLYGKLPGEFNIAASSLFGGHYEKTRAAHLAWDMFNPEKESPISMGHSNEEAGLIFKAAIAFAGTDVLFQAAMKPGIHIVDTQSKLFEIAEIHLPGSKLMQQYASALNLKGEAGTLTAPGMIRFKPWSGPGDVVEDVSDDESDEPESVELENFWLEHDILKLLTVGMKLDVVVHTLNIGLKFFDQVDGIYCSFFTRLPNEEMVHWKDPVPNTRPAPTEDNPDAEEPAIGPDMEL